MKKIEKLIPIKITEKLEFKVKCNYDEPESIEEIINFDNALKIFNVGLSQINRNKVKAEHNFAPLTKKLVEIGAFKTAEECLDFLLTKKGLK